MKKEVRQVEDKEYVDWKFEPGDKVVARYEKPIERKGMYVNYTLGVTHEEHGDIFVKLTGAQFKAVTKEEIGDLTGKTIEAYEYTNDYGKQVGVKVLKEGE